MTKMKFRKTFQIGLFGTATRSVTAAVNYMGTSRGLHVIHGMPKDDIVLAEQYMDCLLAGSAKVPWFSHYDFLGELAAPIWRQLDEQWKNSRFILCQRPLDDWAKSTKRKRSGRRTFRRRKGRLQDNDNPMGQVSVLIALIVEGSLTFSMQVERYKQHNAEVIEYFKDRPDDLLVFDCFSGDSWGKLGAFLDLPLPSRDIPFPRIEKKVGSVIVPYEVRKLRRRYGVPRFAGDN